MKMDLIICGVGGQGNLLASVAVANYSMQQGLNVIGTETIGAAQRGGSVVSHLRISDSRIYSPLVPVGAADFILGFEPVEALRHAERLNPAGSYIINAEMVPTVLCSMGLDRYPSMDTILEQLDRCSSKGFVVSASEKARELGGVIMTNIVLLGAMTCVSDFFDQSTFIDVLKKILPARVQQINLRAFEAGCRMVE